MKNAGQAALSGVFLQIKANTTRNTQNEIPEICKMIYPKKAK